MNYEFLVIDGKMIDNKEINKKLEYFSSKSIILPLTVTCKACIHFLSNIKHIKKCLFPIKSSLDFYSHNECMYCIERQKKKSIYP